ncbi:MAG: hypothetical protein K8S25_14355 [Alphaproteobacteria bacterium]|nr:hypothetical protein [Alphaproteobacteria bacterium]
MTAGKSKRGRPRLKAGEGKQATILARVGADLRDALQTAADGHGVSLSREVEARLRESLALPGEIEAIVRAFGGEEAFALMASSAHLMATMVQRGKTSWVDDPYLFEMALKIMTYMMEQFRPEGAVKRPKGGLFRRSDIESDDDDQALTTVSVMIMMLKSEDRDAPAKTTVKGAPMFRAEALVGREAVAKRLRAVLARRGRLRAG